MARIGLLHSVKRERANGIDAKHIECLRVSWLSHIIADCEMRIAD